MATDTEKRISWVRALAGSYGLNGAAERLGVHPDDLASLLGSHDPEKVLITLLYEAIGNLMKRHPVLVPISGIDFSTGPRNSKTIPLVPYSDESEFFGEEIAFKASIWRRRRKYVARLRRDSPNSTAALLAREDLLRIEIELMRYDGMTLGTEQPHSQAVNYSTLRLRERWEWRVRELADMVKARSR